MAHIMSLSMKLFNGSLLLNEIKFLTLQIWLKPKFQFTLMDTFTPNWTSLLPSYTLFPLGTPYLSSTFTTC